MRENTSLYVNVPYGIPIEISLVFIVTMDGKSDNKNKLFLVTTTNIIQYSILKYCYIKNIKNKTKTNKQTTTTSNKYKKC